MKVVLTREALANLDHIAERIELDNPERAISFIDELREAVHWIADISQGYPLIPRYERYGVRRRSYRGHGILYRLEVDRILVLRFLGPGQDHDRALGLI